jgi:hypothetical protein
VPAPPAIRRAEPARLLLAPAVAFLASSLALCCLVTIPDTVAGSPTLSVVDSRLPGWAGVAVVLALAVGAVTLVVSVRVGPAPPLALGTVAALLGLALSRDVTSSPQLELALLTQAVAVGALVTSALCMVDDLPAPWARATLAGWTLPMAGGWVALAWLASRPRGHGGIWLGVHPAGWALAAVAAISLVWAVLTMLQEPARPPNPAGDLWQNAWAALGFLVVGVGSIVLLLGFQPDPGTSWVRPVVLLTTAVTVGGLLGCGWLMPVAWARPAYLAVVVTLSCGPPCLQLLVLVPAHASGPLSTRVGLTLAVGALAGVGVAWWRPRGSITTGLAVMALGAAGGWVMPANQWLMCAAAAPFAAGVAAACAGGLRAAAADRIAVRYVSMAGLTALLLSLLGAAPLTWAVGAAVTSRASDARAAGRVLLGLTFALAVLACAGASVLLGEGARPGVPATTAMNHELSPDHPG